MENAANNRIPSTAKDTWVFPKAKIQNKNKRKIRVNIGANKEMILRAKNFANFRLTCWQQHNINKSNLSLFGRKENKEKEKKNF